jgi:hypothetical protein
LVSVAPTRLVGEAGHRTPLTAEINNAYDITSTSQIRLHGVEHT